MTEHIVTPGVTPETFAELFKTWWAELDEADKIDFVQSDGGNENLARFVCALEMHTVRSGKKDIAEAYALAFGCSPATAKKNAYGPRGLKHPAVLNLLTRLRQKSREVAWMRLEAKYSQLLERMLDDALDPKASPIQRYYAATCAQKYGTLVKLQEAETRAQRRALSAGKARLVLAGDTDVGLSEENIRVLIRQLEDKLPKELPSADRCEEPVTADSNA